MANDLALAVDEDVIRYEGEAYTTEDRRLPESSVADGDPGDGVTLQFLPAGFKVSIETDG